MAVLAAGASRRMGFPKQLTCIQGKSLVARACELATGLDAANRAIVLGAYRSDIEQEIRTFPLSVVSNDEWDEGQSSSLRILSSYALRGGFDRLLIMPVDMPFLSVGHLVALVNRLGADEGRAAVAASDDGVRLMAPCVFDRRVFPALGRLEGDRGASSLIRSGRCVVVSERFPEPIMSFDVDTPEKLAQARKMIGGREI